MDEEQKKRIRELIQEEISIVPYDAHWVEMYKDEAKFLMEGLPAGIIRRVEHFGSTSVPGLPAKPIIDMHVEISSAEETKEKIVPILKARNYVYFWRPAFGDNTPPFYSWFIKRNAEGKRTHHIHMVEADSELWDRICFRDYLREFPEEAERYGDLKKRFL